MTYRIEQFVRKIASPIIAEYEDHRAMYGSGDDFANSIQDKPYVIERIYAEESKIVIRLNINNSINDTSWSDTDQSYF